MSSVFFRTKLDTPEQLTAHPGQLLSDVYAGTAFRAMRYLPGATVRACPREEPATFAAARESGQRVGIEQVIVDAEDVDRVFRLRGHFVEAMNETVAGEGGHPTMAIGHQGPRRMLEVPARKRGANVIADDLVASVVRWLTSSFRMGDIPVREIGEMRYVFPLYQLTEKELTLYLELVMAELNRQGPPGRFTTGPDERFDPRPGADYPFSSFENVQRYMFRICEGVYLPQEGVSNAPDLCDVCDLFARRELTTVW